MPHHKQTKPAPHAPERYLFKLYGVDRFNLRKLADKLNVPMIDAAHRAIAAECRKNAIEPLEE